MPPLALEDYTNEIFYTYTTRPSLWRLLRLPQALLQLELLEIKTTNWNSAFNKNVVGENEIYSL